MIELEYSNIRLTICSEDVVDLSPNKGEKNSFILTYKVNEFFLINFIIIDYEYKRNYWAGIWG